ncbi:uncharacterized protein LOC106460599 [Limulus polyphemus]|uniref:Uncharacterized protein LOC106460599 n=1 Tax=Limulus polyphemus TaxID=6850 RepID=A0ABM1B6G3_LIMPO|nr:uncharacterized protein LOC106460599 [Limulus polyphemus]
MYEGARTQVRTSVGLPEKFTVAVGLHQGSSLSPYIFDMIMDVQCQGIIEPALWDMLFADDIVLIDTTREGEEQKLKRCRRAMEDRGLKVSREKTEYMVFNGEEEMGDVTLLNDKLKRVNTFEYLGFYVASNGTLDSEINHRIQSGWRNWKNWKNALEVLCDNKISARVKGKVYKTVVRPAMMYGAEAWPIKKAQEKKLEIAEMKMLRWMCGVTRLDRTRNERIRGTTKVVEISKKVQERRLQWYGHPRRFWIWMWRGEGREEDQREDGRIAWMEILERKALVGTNTKTE